MASPRPDTAGADPDREGPDLVVPLVDAGDRPLEEVGGKARTLGRLMQEGFPVPDGVVLPAPAVVSDAEPDAEGVNGGESDPAAGLEARLEDVARRLGPGPLAVRSSGAAEDSDDSSYAGQFRTELDVSGTEELRAAIRRCRDAVSADHLRTYRTSRADSADEGDAPRLALIVQRMVDADASGVAFTADPRSGSREAVVVEAVEGPGESLVSGERTPERWRVSESGVEREEGDEHVLDEETAAEVARLARRVERTLDGPQDLEWAVADGELHLLQSRPVTTGVDVEPVPISVDPPDEGFWFRDDAHFPRPFHPLFSSIYVPRYREAVAGAFEEFGVLVDGLEIREIGGWPYSRIVPPAGKEGPPPPSWVLWILSRVAPSLRVKMENAREALEEDRADEYVQRWWEEWRPELDRWIRRADELDLAALDRTELGEHYRECVQAFDRGLRIHFRLFPPFFLAVTDLVFFCREALGWEKGRATDLLGGVSMMSSEPGRALEDLAEEAADRPDVSAILEDPGEDPVERLRRHAPEFMEAFREYQDRYGLRVLHYDFGMPTFRERPELVLGFVRDLMDGGGAGPSSGSAAELSEERAREARRVLDGRPEARERFDGILERARRAYPVREDNEFFALSVLGLLRYASLEVGRRMVRLGHLERAEQVFYLEHDEVVRWLEEPGYLEERARRREGERRWALANPGPPSYGEDPGPPPDPSALPPAGRKVTRALLWMVENDIQTPTEESEGVEGVAASGGRYTGPVRVVRSEEEFDRVRAGDVLVCPITSPTWSVLFPSIGALVTDAGGLLSHPAIIAREFGIPAVLATGDATEELDDGEIVTVDGAAGRVERA